MNKRENVCQMIPGNVDKTVMTFRKDLHCYHLQVTTRIIDPRNPTFPIVKTRILVLRPMDYKTYFEGSPESNIGYLKCMNFAAATLVWDPSSKEARELDAKVKAEQLAEREALSGNEHKMREGKRKATIGDIDRLLKEK